MELAEILWYKSLTKSGVGFLDDCADKGNDIVLQYYWLKTNSEYNFIPELKHFIETLDYFQRQD